MANAHDCRSFFSFLGMMCHWRVLFLGVVIQCGAFNTMGQTIVNTETLLLDADSAISWTAGVAGDHSSGNVNVMDFSADAGFAWKPGGLTVKGLAAWATLAQGGEAIQSSAFGQIRLSAGDPTVLAPFVFVQTSSNNVLLLEQRNLLGLGAKRRLVDRTTFWMEASLGAFSEREWYAAASEAPSKLIRNSVIFSSSVRASEIALLRMTTFVQTAYSDFRDTRVFVEFSANVSLSKVIALEWNLGFRWDGEPHGGLGGWDLGNAVGLRFGLNEEDNG